MRILQINTTDVQGGAAKVAHTLHRAYLATGHDAYLLVGATAGESSHIWQLDNRRHGHPWWLARGVVQRALGWQDLSYPGSHRLPTSFPQGWDVLHAHNLHGFYFDLAALPTLARHAPVVLTLHDMWAITGHCGYALECERWRVGCGKCPDLQRYPAIRADGTRFNWRRKQRLFQQSVDWITAPAQWLLDLLDDSLLAGLPRRLIPNGVNLNDYQPASKAVARQQLGLPVTGAVLLFVASPANIYKDFDTLRQALDRLFETLPADQKPVMLVLGGAASGRAIDWGQAGDHVRLEPFTANETEVARYYQAADILVHAARAEVLPNTILEAMACGCAVLASDVGGVREEIVHQETGLLVPAGDPQAMVEALRVLLGDTALVERMGRAGRAHVERHFDMRDMVSAYLQLYVEAIAARQREGRRT